MGKTIAWEIQGSPNVGLFAYATDSYCLIGKALTEGDYKTFEKALEVPLMPFTVGGSSQVGVYVAGNSNMLLVPSSIEAKEIAILEKYEIAYTVLDTKESALGNNIICNDNYFFCHPDMKASIKDIEKALGCKGETLSLEDWEVIGSIAKLTSKGGLVQNDVPEDVKEHMEAKLGITFERGTLNFGSHTISGCVCVNKNGMVVGKASAGVEITNADMAFGFLD